ncbi:MAG: MMPL family transporter [Lachnospiraceae bacterium]
MIKAGKWIARHRKFIVCLAILLLIPSVFGIKKTKINYDVLSYLPSSLETVKGQDLLVDEFGMGAFSIVIVEDMQPKDTVKLEEQMEGIAHVKDVLWYDDLADISVPIQVLPSEVKEAFNHGNATMMVALFEQTTSSDDTMKAVSQMRTICKKQCFVSGMSGVVTDIKNLSLQEMPVYVVIAATLSLLVLMLTMESWIVPVLFLLSIGMAILYNLGSNVFLGEISYITKALTAVLQLGVTMDYSIFLLNSYDENQQRFPGEKERAMAHAISNTFKSITGSSVTTIAGFAALCFMTFALGRDIGIVMSKGVVIGVLCCVTLLPSLILIFDKAIEKTKHKAIVPDLRKISDFITKHYRVWLVLFAILLLPAIYGNNHTKVYYNIDKGLPSTLQSSIANKKLEKDFKMNSVYMVLLKNQELQRKDKNELLKKMEQVKGVKWTLGMESMVGPSIPEDMVPADVEEMLKSDQYEVQFICSNYKTATDQMNRQVAHINKIVKSYSKGSIVIGEAPLTKDLAVVTDTDMKNVNIASVIAIFVIIMLVFKSISLPVILVSVIEFAIFVNMAVPYYMNTSLPFVASIVIGTIQLGATVDYAILMTSRYQKERFRGKPKQEAIRIAHELSMKSILISGVSFFAATFGVGLYSKIDMISSICTLLSRGAIISTLVVITILPAMFMIFDKVICKTSKDFQPKK